MNTRNIFLIVIAVLIAGVAAFLARSMMQDKPAQVEAAVEAKKVVKTKEILVAAKPLPIGKLIEAVDLRWQPWPEEAMNERYFSSDKGQLDAFVGKVVRHSIVIGEPLTESKVVGPGQSGFLAAVLAPGMRAVSVPINQTSGIAGFIFPGDHVDIILTHQVNKRQVSETALYNVRVLAVDQRTDDQATAPALGQTVTLEVTPKIAEMVSVLRQLGGLSLSLRSLAQDGKDKDGPSLNPKFGSDAPSYTWDADVSVLIPKIGEAKPMSVTRGAKNSAVNFQESVQDMNVATSAGLGELAQ